jgi:hypothetical protein
MGACCTNTIICAGAAAAAAATAVSDFVYGGRVMGLFAAREVNGSV